MKLLVIPDVHGLTNWHQQCVDAIISRDTHIVFLGDYVDTHNEDINPYDILINLEDIIEFKKRYPQQVTLLLGNHDLAYVFSKTYTTGFESYMWKIYYDIFNLNWNLFDLAWGFQGENKYTLLTHAGLTQPFYDNVVESITTPGSLMNQILCGEGDEDWHLLPLHELLNYFKDNIELLWQIGKVRKGLDLTGSIVWADKSELSAYNYPGIDQMVGHTNGYYVEIKEVDGDKLYFLDVHTSDSVIGFMAELT